MTGLALNIFIAIVVLLGSAVALVSTVLVLRVIKAREERLLAQYKQFFETFLLDFLFDEEARQGSFKWKHFVRKFSYPKVKRLQRKALISVMLAQHKNMNGEPAERLENLYQSLNFPYTTLSRYWFSGSLKRAYYIHELSEFKVQSALRLARKNYQSKNLQLREESLFAMVKLGGPQNISFLKTFPDILTDWQQTRLLKELARYKTAEIPSFSFLLESFNQSVLNFALELIQYFDQINAEKSVCKAYDNLSDANKILALDTAEKLGFFSVYDLAKQHLNTASQKIVIKTLKLAASFETQSNPDWLLEFIKHDSVSVSKAAAFSYVKLTKAQSEKFVEVADMLTVKQAVYETAV